MTMKAYLKLMLIAALAFAWDHAAWAPQRESLAVCEDAKYDSPRCVQEMIQRALELERSYAATTATTGVTPPASADLWEAAQVEHLRTCRHNHLTDKFYRRQHPVAHRVAALPASVHCLREPSIRNTPPSPTGLPSRRTT
jgi:hypothetical protein